jgi:hypothetical protein
MSMMIGSATTSNLTFPPAAKEGATVPQIGRSASGMSPVIAESAA